MDEKVEILLNGQRFKKFQENCYAPVMEKYDLTLLELKVLVFLQDHDHCNTARDIVQIHNYTKSNVSKAVEILIQRGMLEKEQDAHDHRYQKLLLRENALPVVSQAQRQRQKMLQVIFEGVTEEEMKVIASVAKKVTSNLASGLHL